MLEYIDSLGGVSFDSNNERFKDFNGEICISEHYNAEFEDFFKAINAYSSILLSKEDRFMMEIRMFQDKWYNKLKGGDEYYNPNLTLDKTDFSYR